MLVTIKAIVVRCRHFTARRLFTWTIFACWTWPATWSNSSMTGRSTVSPTCWVCHWPIIASTTCPRTSSTHLPTSQISCFIATGSSSSGQGPSSVCAHSSAWRWPQTDLLPYRKLRYVTRRPLTTSGLLFSVVPEVKWWRHHRKSRYITRRPLTTSGLLFSVVREVKWWRHRRKSRVTSLAGAAVPRPCRQQLPVASALRISCLDVCAEDAVGRR